MGSIQRVRFVRYNASSYLLRERNVCRKAYFSKGLEAGILAGYVRLDQTSEDMCKRESFARHVPSMARQCPDCERRIRSSNALRLRGRQDLVREQGLLCSRYSLVDNVGG
jgi:hypothetical protein